MEIKQSRHTIKMLEKMQNWGLEQIEQIDDDIEKLEENGKAIVEYLNDLHFSSPLGTALRVHIADKYSTFFDEKSGAYTFVLKNGEQVKTKDYNSDDYDFTKDDLAQYTDIIISIIETYNADCAEKIMKKLTRQEIRRLLKATTCQRSKMFLLGFALHMNEMEMHKFLTDILAEQTYNYRNPHEIIALFCQSHEEHNTYSEYLRMVNEYDSLEEVSSKEKDDYTLFAKSAMQTDINTEEELMAFLAENKANFKGYSFTAYNEFKKLYDEAMSKSTYITRRYETKKVENNEQLAKEILTFIPRATFEKEQDDKKIVTNDFIPVSRGDEGSKSPKIKTTDLPKEITKNLLISDRLDDLLKKKKAVERKDLVFMKFYVFSLYLREKEEYLISDYFIFVDECNDLLIRCGMSRLYAGNRFENLIMLSLAASRPYDMFGDIIESTFFNEPSIDIF